MDKQVLLKRKLPLIVMQPQITNIWSVRIRVPPPRQWNSKGKKTYNHKHYDETEQ